MSAYGNTAGFFGANVQPRADKATAGDTSALPNVRGLAEGAAILVVLSGIDLALGNHAMLGMQPHPYGLAVLLIAAQYGIAEAGITALLATALLFGLNPVSQQFGQDRVAWLGGLAFNPLLWCAVALVVGAVTNRLRRLNAELAASAAAARTDLSDMVATNNQLAERLSTLEARVAGQLNTVSAIYEAARNLGTEAASVLQGAPALIQAATQCTKCSVYLLDGGVLRLGVSDGWEQSDPFPHTIEGTALFDTVVGQRSTLLANRPSDGRILAGSGVLAAPVIDPVGGAVLGMVKVEAIGFTDFTLDTVANFRAVASWLAQALSHASKMAEAQAERFLIDPRVISSRHSATVASQITRVAARIGFNLWMLQIQIPPVDNADWARATMLEAMRIVFRASDILMEADMDHRHFNVLLPGIPSEGVRDAADRLFAALQERDPALCAVTTMACVHLHQATEPAHAD